MHDHNNALLAAPTAGRFRRHTRTLPHHHTGLTMKPGAAKRPLAERALSGLLHRIRALAEQVELTGDAAPAHDEAFARIEALTTQLMAEALLVQRQVLGD